MRPVKPPVDVEPARRAVHEALADEAFVALLRRWRAWLLRARAAGRRGEHRGRRRGAGLELADHRAYAPGDDFRALDFNAWARTDRPVVRVYEEDQDAVLAIIVDASASMACGSHPAVARAAQCAGLLAAAALGAADRVVVAGFAGDEVSVLGPLRGGDQLGRVLAFLRALPMGGRTRPERAAQAVAARVRSRGHAVWLTDALVPDALEAATRSLVARRYDVALVHLVDRRSFDEVGRGVRELVDAESGERVVVDVDERAVARARAAYDALGERVQRWCAGRGVGYARIDVRAPVAEASRALRRVLGR